MLTPGTLLQNRYRVGQPLGRGGMGVVYEATDERLGRTVAVKELLVEGSELRRAFEREARLLANLLHPSLPRVTDHFADGEGHYLVMDFVPGDDLKRMMDERGAPLQVDDVLHWADQLLDALEYLHGHEPPVIHRDIKPSNLKLLRNGRIVLLDFGLAKGSVGQTQAATLSRSVFGYSPHFASLEQMQGEKSTPRSDLYSLSATLYYLLTGSMPPDALARATAVFNEEIDPLVPLRTLNPAVPEKAAGLITSGLELRTSARPASAAAMRAQLAGSPTGGDLGVDEITKVARRTVPLEQVVPSATRPATMPAPASAAPSEDFAQHDLPTSRHWHRKLIITVGFLIALIAMSTVGYVLLSSRVVRRLPPSSNAPAFLPQLEPAGAAALMLWATDADGNRLAGGGGAFVTSEEAVVPLSGIEGASLVSVSVADQKAALRVVSVTHIDRERRVAIVKVEGGRGTPLNVPGGVPAKVGDRVKLVGIGSDMGVRYSDGEIGVSQKGSLEVHTGDTAVGSGWIVLREAGELIGLLTDWSGTGSFTLLPATAILDMMKRKSSPQPVEVAGAKDILFDFRSFNDSPKRPTLSPQQESALFTSVFGPKPPSPDESFTTCEEEQDKCLAAARAAWRIKPEILSMVSGAFTQPGTQQNAYLIAVNEEGATHADNFGSKRLAIFDGQKLVVNTDIGDFWDILQTYDLNRDGISELLLSGVYSQMGETIVWSKLAEFTGGRQRVVKDFDKVYTDNCNASSKDGKMLGTQILYTPALKGSFPSGFRQDVYRATCAEHPNWNYLPGGSVPSL
jgi:serine/threonine protein kinase